jgi:hypothetical protein
MKTPSPIESHTKAVLELVRHPDFYARKVSVLEKALGLTTDEILQVASRTPSLGTFTYNGELFIGLTERKAAYEEDATRGINPFEPNYRGDEYRAAVLNGKSRFPAE